MGINRLAGASFWLTASQIGCEGLGLLRNVFLARLIGPSEMGIATTLALSLRLLEMISDLAADRLIVQAADGDEPRFQANAQAIQLARGLLAGVLLAITAVPVSWLFGQPQAAWAFAALGLVPAVRGLMHLDYRRVQRGMQFRPAFLVELPASALAAGAALPLGWALRDYSVMVWVSLIQAAVMVGASHLLSQRPYHLRLDRDLVRRFASFGWPLAINGLILFGVFQGDRLVVALSFSAADLGRYALAFQLAMIPSMIIGRVVSSLGLPLMSRVQDDPDAFRGHYETATIGLAVVALGFSTGFVILGNATMELLFGPAFCVSHALIGWLGAAQGIRILRTMASVAAMARADSRMPLLANLTRFFGVAGAALIAFAGGSMEAVAAAGWAGEVVAAGASLVLLERRAQLPARSMLWSTSVVTGATCLAWVFL